MRSYTSIREVREELRRVWSGDPEALALCEAILDYLSERAHTADFVTFQDLSRGRYKGKPETLIAVAKYLASDDVPLLDAKFQFISDDDDEFTADRHLYSPKDLEVFAKEGFFDPRTGERVPDYADKLYMLFQPTEFARSLFRHRTRRR